MELLLGGSAAAMAGAICNPLEVIKIRMQLQGELQSKGKYNVHYRNVFHATYQVASKDGILALQKGLVPFVFYQFACNTARLGLYQIASQRGLTKNSDGSVNTLRTLFYAVACGAVGGVFCSPFFLVKTHLQSKANAVIAVGYQHKHSGMREALFNIYREGGIRGLWRGASSMVPRIAAANAAQLLSFEKSHEYMKTQFPNNPWVALMSACFAAGIFMSLTMAPFDLVATRFYNQGTNSQGRGLLYRSVPDCIVKVYQAEGALGFFKGWTACYFRLGPYTFLLLVFWEKLKFYHNEWKLVPENREHGIELKQN